MLYFVAFIKPTVSGLVTPSGGVIGLVRGAVERIKLPFLVIQNDSFRKDDAAAFILEWRV